MITIVIPSYNHAQYLPVQIASIIRQGSKVSKIIVVDDASTDNTAAVLSQIQIHEPRLMVKSLNSNVGYWRAAHIGLSYVDTDFFAFASADDFLMPDWAETSLDALLSAPGAAVCLSRIFVSSGTTPAALTKTVLPKRLRGTVLSPREFHASIMRYGTFMESCTALYRCSAYEENFVELESAGSFSDGVILHVLGLKAGAVVVDEVLGVFFVRDGSISGAAVAPSVGVALVQELSNILKISPCKELFDQKLALRLVRRNTYAFLINSAQHLTSEFSEFSKRTLPPLASIAIRISLWIVFHLLRLTAFICLRPFDLINAKRRSNDMATPDEKSAVYGYQKALNDSLPSIGVDS